MATLPIARGSQAAARRLGLQRDERRAGDTPGEKGIKYLPGACATFTMTPGWRSCEVLSVRSAKTVRLKTSAIFG